jgi:predicted phage-related endonuclease
MKKDFDRKQGIGGSDATRIYQGNWYELYQEKIGEKESDDLSDVLPVQMGIHTEDFNIRWFEKQTGIKVLKKQVFITSKQYPFLYCNIDGVLKEKRALLECKHTNAFSNEVKTADKYKAQIQHYLMIYGAAKMYLSIFFGNMKYGLVEVLPDKEFQEQLLAAEVLFWHMVETKTPPPDFVDFNNFDQQLKEHNNGRQIIPILTR